MQLECQEARKPSQTTATCPDIDITAQYSLPLALLNFYSMPLSIFDIYTFGELDLIRKTYPGV
jgi:hypothetical protein